MNDLPFNRGLITVTELTTAIKEQTDTTSETTGESVGTTAATTLPGQPTEPTASGSTLSATQTATQTVTQPATQAPTAPQSTTRPATQPTTQTPTAPPTTTTAKSVPVVAGAYYVSTGGNDANDGSATSPFKTIQKAINLVPAGSTIIVTAGTYNEKLVISGKSGLTIKNQTGEMPILNGAGFSSGYLIDISGSSNIVFSGFEVCNFKGSELEGVIIRKASRSIEISNSKFHDIGTTSSTGNAHVILASGSSNTPMTGITIKNNEIYSCNTGRSESITMESNVDGFSITGNKIHDVTNIAIDIAGFFNHGVTAAGMNQARNGTIANNLVYNVNCPYASCAAIYVDGGRDVVIERNTVRNSMYGIEVGCENPVDELTSVRAVVSGVTVRYNTVYNNSKVGFVIGGYDGTQTGHVVNCSIYNNTFYKNHTELELSYCDNISLSKNIFYGSTGSSHLVYNDSGNAVTNLKMSNNVFFAEGGSGSYQLSSKSASNLAGWQSISGQDMDSRFVNPLFVNPASANFSLQAGSPAVGIGSK